MTSGSGADVKIDSAHAPDPAVNSFLAHLVSERRLSNHTVDAYRRDLGRLDEWRTTRAAGSWKRLKSGDARAFAATLHSKGLSGRSIARALSAARSFYVWMRREKMVSSDPFAGISAPKSSKKLPQTLSAEQATALVSIEGDDFLSVRDRAMIELMYSSGLRLSEVRRRGRTGALHQCQRHTSWPARRADSSASVGDQARAASGRPPAHAAPLVCESHAGVERRLACGAGTTGARQHNDDRGLYASRLSAPVQGVRRIPPARAKTTARRCQK